MTQEWSRIACAVARETHKRVGLDTTTAGTIGDDAGHPGTKNSGLESPPRPLLGQNGPSLVLKNRVLPMLTSVADYDRPRNCYDNMNLN